jgi:hypothetical protein
LGVRLEKAIKTESKERRETGERREEETDRHAG